MGRVARFPYGVLLLHRIDYVPIRKVLETGRCVPVPRIGQLPPQLIGGHHPGVDAPVELGKKPLVLLPGPLHVALVAPVGAGRAGYQVYRVNHHIRSINDADEQATAQAQ